MEGHFKQTQNKSFFLCFFLLSFFQKLNRNKGKETHCPNMGWRGECSRYMTVQSFLFHSGNFCYCWTPQKHLVVESFIPVIHSKSLSKQQRNAELLSI